MGNNQGFQFDMSYQFYSLEILYTNGPPWANFSLKIVKDLENENNQ